jgi:dienelactone hydrolase
MKPLFSLRYTTFVITLFIAFTLPAAERFTGAWNLAALKRTPTVEWGTHSNLTQEVYYEGEPVNGVLTRVFAYVGRPADRSGKLPAMVLVHGGGGKAFANWAQMWAERGYVALAMDLTGKGPDGKPLPEAGPDQRDWNIFRPFTEADLKELWPYHAVAAVIRGHSLLANLPEVDARRIGITGISWGGYLTCIVAGLDDRLKCAIPVYGSGFLWEDSAWLGQFQRLGPVETKRWSDSFDPSKYLPGVRCPILFVNRPTDFHYRLAVHQKSRQLVPNGHDLHMDIKLSHSHPAGWAPKEIALFADSVLRGGKSLARLGELKRNGEIVTAKFKSTVPIVRGELCFTTEADAYEKRKWQATPAEVTGQEVWAKLPEARPLTFFLNIIDQRGAITSSAHVELPAVSK